MYKANIKIFILALTLTAFFASCKSELYYSDITIPYSLGCFDIDTIRIENPYYILDENDYKLYVLDSTKISSPIDNPATFINTNYCYEVCWGMSFYWMVYPVFKNTIPKDYINSEIIKDLGDGYYHIDYISKVDKFVLSLMNISKVNETDRHAVDIGVPLYYPTRNPQNEYIRVVRPVEDEDKSHIQ